MQRDDRRSAPSGPAWLRPLALTSALAVALPGLATALASRGGHGDVRSTLTAVGRSSAYGVGAAAGPGWLAPVKLSSPRGPSILPQLAMDPAGDAIAVFLHSAGGDYDATVHATVRAPSGGFSAPVNVSGAGELPTAAVVAMDQAGDAIVAWQRGFAYDESVHAVVRPAGGRFSGPIRVSGPGSTDALASADRPPRLAMNAAGDAIVVWEGSGPNDTHFVQVAVRPAHGAFSPPVTLSAAGGALRAEDVAIDPAGNAIVVWARAKTIEGNYPLTNMTIQMSTRPAGGSFSAPIDLARGGNVNPVVALDPAGDTIIAWTHLIAPQNDQVDGIVQATVRPTGGTFSPPFAVSGSRGSSFSPQVALDASGNAIAAWAHSQRLGPKPLANVQAALRPAGGRFSKPFNLSAPHRDPGGLPLYDDPTVRVAVNAAGDTATVWKRFSRRGETIVGTTRAAGEPFARPRRLSAQGNPTGSIFNLSGAPPAVAIDRAGNAIAIWERDHGKASSVEGSAHAREGTKP